MRYLILSDIHANWEALQAVLPPMVEAKQGQVVVFTSATGARPDPITSIYGGTNEIMKLLIARSL